jgi:hypothetical protein
MLCGCRGDRWPIRCLMANEVERGFYNAGLFSSLFGQFFSLIISNDVCMGSVWALTLKMVILWWQVFSVLSGCIGRMNFLRD